MSSENTAQIMKHMSLEGVVEGVPLIASAVAYMSDISTRCAVVTCSPDQISTNFPSLTMTLMPSSRPISSQDVLAVQNEDCRHLPLTTDGWFSMRLQDIDYVERETGFLEREIEFPLFLETPGAQFSRMECCHSELNEPHAS